MPKQQPKFIVPDWAREYYPDQAGQQEIPGLFLGGLFGDGGASNITTQARDVIGQTGGYQDPTAFTEGITGPAGHTENQYTTQAAGLLSPEAIQRAGQQAGTAANAAASGQGALGSARGQLAAGRSAADAALGVQLAQAQALAGIGQTESSLGLQGQQLQSGHALQQAGIEAGIYGTNVGAQTGQDQLGLQAQQAKAQAEQSANAAAGALLGSAATAAGTYAASDDRIKFDEKPVGTLGDGINVYEYYNELTGRKETGVIAQEVQKARPELVAQDPQTGMLGVNYDELKKSYQGSPGVNKIDADVTVTHKDPDTGRTTTVKSPKGDNARIEDMLGGGQVPGKAPTPVADNQLARVTPGEFVVNAPAASKYADLLETINDEGRQALAAGGWTMGPGQVPPMTAHPGKPMGYNIGGKISKLHGEGFTAPGQAYAIAKNMGYAMGGEIPGYAIGDPIRADNSAGAGAGLVSNLITNASDEEARRGRENVSQAGHIANAAGAVGRAAVDAGNLLVGNTEVEGLPTKTFEHPDLGRVDIDLNKVARAGLAIPNGVADIVKWGADKISQFSVTDQNSNIGTPDTSSIADIVSLAPGAVQRDAANLRGGLADVLNDTSIPEMQEMLRSPQYSKADKDIIAAKLNTSVGGGTVDEINTGSFDNVDQERQRLNTLIGEDALTGQEKAIAQNRLGELETTVDATLTEDVFPGLEYHELQAMANDPAFTRAEQEAIQAEMDRRNTTDATTDETFDFAKARANEAIGGKKGSGLSGWWKNLTPEKRAALFHGIGLAAGVAVGGVHGGAGAAEAIGNNILDAGTKAGEDLRERRDSIAGQFNDDTKINVDGNEIRYGDLTPENKSFITKELASLYSTNPEEAATLSQDLLGRDIFATQPDAFANFSDAQQSYLKNLNPDLQSRALSAINSGKATADSLKDQKQVLNNSRSAQLGIDDRDILLGPNAPGEANEAGVRRIMQRMIVGDRQSMASLIAFADSSKVTQTFPGAAAWLGDTTAKEGQIALRNLAFMETYARTGAQVNETELKEQANTVMNRWLDAPGSIDVKIRGAMQRTIDTLYTKGYELPPEMLVLRSKNYDINDPVVKKMFSGDFEPVVADGKQYFKQGGQWFDLSTGEEVDR